MTEDYSRPATLDDVKALMRGLNAQNADYLLIGGYALFAPATIGPPPTSMCWFRQTGRRENGLSMR